LGGRRIVCRRRRSSSKHLLARRSRPRCGRTTACARERVMEDMDGLEARQVFESGEHCTRRREGITGCIMGQNGTDRRTNISYNGEGMELRLCLLASALAVCFLSFWETGARGVHCFFSNLHARRGFSGDSRDCISATTTTLSETQGHGLVGQGFDRLRKSCSPAQSCSER
jgi:hypothetical protein